MLTENNRPRFSIYRHPLVLEDSTRVDKLFIVVKDHSGLLEFTDFHKYVHNPRRRIVAMNQSNETRFTYVVKFLNFAFFTCGIKRLDDLTVDVVKEFLTRFGMCTLPGDIETTHRSKATVERCTTYIMDFLLLVYYDRQDQFSISPNKLFKKENRRNKRGDVVKVKVPVFDVTYKPTMRRPIFRDIPDRAFHLLFEHILNHHKELLGVFILGAFAGLRPSEACNVLRPSSPLRPGILFDVVDGEVLKIRINLSSELIIRSDKVNVGKIKKERIQQVPDIFLNVFYSAHQGYMRYLEKQKYEPEFAPYSVNSRGKALTYDSYLEKFKTVIKEEMIPIYLASGDPEVVLYGRTLMEHSLTPHVLRHYFTVQLVLSGVNDPGLLMYWRGDTSPESALQYLQSKIDLERLYTKVGNTTFDYLKWAMEKKYEKN